jgi:hypothetical protein
MRAYSLSAALAAIVMTAATAQAGDSNAPPVAPATTATTENPIWTPDAATIAQVRNIVANTQGAEGVFVVQDDGRIRHVQSGLICRAKYPNVSFWHAFVYPSSAGLGTDVGCDYGRYGSDGKAVSKLSIFATKTHEGMTLDQAFARYRNEVVQSTPDAVSHGDAVGIENKDSGQSSGLPEIRSEVFSEVLDGRPFVSQLLVTMHGGWIIEIRTTFEGVGIDVVTTKDGGVAEAVLEAGDRLMLTHAFVEAISTVGK